MKMPRPHPVPTCESTPLKHAFAPGCQYENMRGTYEIVSVQGEMMRVRWENGDESLEDVRFQDRILCRFEREARLAKGRPSSDPEEEHCFREPFRGLAPADFTTEVAQTTWRSRGRGLRSAVAEDLGAGGHCLESSACFGRPMIRWAAPDRNERGAAGMRTGLFFRLDEACAQYGFFVEGLPDAGRRSEWERTLAWLGAPEHEAWLHSLAVENKLTLADPQETCSFAGVLAASEADWVWTAADGARTIVPGLAAFLSELPRERPAVLECAATLPKDRAIGRSLRLARDVAQLLGALLPLYRAAAGAPEPLNAHRGAAQGKGAGRLATRRRRASPQDG